jgi:hypothetical protein
MCKARVLANTVLLLLCAAPLKAQAQESQAAVCSRKVSQFVVDLDAVLTENPISSDIVQARILRHLPVKGCDVADVIAISKTSKYFRDAYERDSAYTMIFRSEDFTVSFGLRKDSGDIRNPAAQVRGFLRFD